MNANLKEILLARPSVQTVYFNDKGEWLFHNHPQFPTAVSREELLTEPTKGEATELESGEDMATPVISETKVKNNKKR